MANETWQVVTTRDGQIVDRQSFKLKRSAVNTCAKINEHSDLRYRAEIVKISVTTKAAEGDR